MEWTQFIIFFLGVFGLFIWNRTEARTDARHMDVKLEANRNLMFEIHKEIQMSIRAIHDEMKDFHGRLEKQDAEFKAFMRGIEQERNRKLFIKD